MIVLVPVALAALSWVTGLDMSGRSVSRNSGESSLPRSVPASAAADAPTGEHAVAGARRDLRIDEQAGGHTLARHVGKTDDELRARLSRERNISAASTYTDVDTAERTVGAALAESNRRLDAWLDRTGSRPNLVLNYRSSGGPAIGRSVPRGASTAVECDRALVVLRWDRRADRWFVLTSYPEARR